MKIIRLLLIPCISCYSTYAQDSSSVKNKIEVRLALGLQRPFYVGSDLLDITIPKQPRYRSSISAGARYYPFNRWFAEYQLGYSQEGAGYAQQYTNANYLKNSLFLGFSAKHSRFVIFDIYTGVDFNILLAARFKNSQTGKFENVRSYFNATQFQVPIGMGVKTKIKSNYFVGLSALVNMGFTPVNKNGALEKVQFVVPVFKLSLTKIIR